MGENPKAADSLGINVTWLQYVTTTIGSMLIGVAGAYLPMVYTGTFTDGIVQGRTEPEPVRWAILHVIDHTALHLGHMQLTLQLWQGGRTAGGPRWFERV